MDPGGEFPGNLFMESPLAEAESVGEIPGEIRQRIQQKQVSTFLWVILSSPEETHVGS